MSDGKDPNYYTHENDSCVAEDMVGLIPIHRKLDWNFEDIEIRFTSISNVHVGIHIGLLSMYSCLPARSAA